MLDDDGWTTHAWWWNKRWGWAQVDLKHRSRGPRHAVLERTGGPSGKVAVIFDGLNETVALEALRVCLTRWDGWSDKLAAMRQQETHVTAASRRRTAPASGDLE